jgi:hypothetical protein
MRSQPAHWSGEVSSRATIPAEWRSGRLAVLEPDSTGGQACERIVEKRE